MEQQSENVGLTPIPTNVVPPPPLSLNIVVPPASINIISSPVPTNIVAPSSPTNMAAPPIPTNTVPFAQNIPLQSINQIPPLGPAPAQLPPLVHPPPPGAPLQSVINSNATIQETKVEPIVPLQTQFETLNLNTPLEPIPSVVSQTLLPNDLIQQQFSSAQINNELNSSQELVDGNLIASPPIDPNATVNLNDESSLVAEEGKRGMY